MAEFFYDTKRIEALIATAERSFRRKFLQAVSQIRDSITLDELELLLAQRRFDEALVQAEIAAVNLSNAYVQAYLLAADDVMSFLSNALGVVVSFDQVNTNAVVQMQQASLRLIREFTTGQRNATRAALVQGIREGLNPRDQARMFRMSIGLTAKQIAAVGNYKRLLESSSSKALDRALRDRRFDASIQAAISGKKPLTEDQIDKMVNRYFERSLAYRAETIARTEALAAVHRGSDAGFLQAIEQGVIDEQELGQQWHTAGDSRVRDPSHTAMSGQIRLFGQPFLSGTGNLLRYPGDHRAPASDRLSCRCVKTTQLTIDIEDSEA